MARRMKRLFGAAVSVQKPKANLIRLESITPGGQHAWCDSDQGLIRKPIVSVPKDLIAEYRKRNAA